MPIEYDQEGAKKLAPSSLQLRRSPALTFSAFAKRSRISIVGLSRVSAFFAQIGMET
jgi:hypothetical protein